MVPNKKKPLGSRFIIGAIVLVLGFIAPVFIPLVTTTNWPTSIKSIIAGLLAFGIPELFMLIAVGIMGKEGFEYIKRFLSVMLRRYGPPDVVSPLRYKIGIIMFVFPLLISIVAPYVGDKIGFYEHHRIIIMVILHVMLVMSLFVLGGDFWEKLRSLFIRRAKIDMESLKK